VCAKKRFEWREEEGVRERQETSVLLSAAETETETETDRGRERDLATEGETKTNTRRERESGLDYHHEKSKGMGSTFLFPGRMLHVFLHTEIDEQRKLSCFNRYVKPNAVERLFKTLYTEVVGSDSEYRQIKICAKKLQGINRPDACNYASKFEICCSDKLLLTAYWAVGNILCFDVPAYHHCVRLCSLPPPRACT
jgi:hypothetical protein